MRAKSLFVILGIMLATVFSFTTPVNASVQPALAGGNYNIVEANGCCAVGANTLSAGDQVIEVSGLGRNMTFTRVTSYFGDDAGWFQFSNGNFMAANNACTGITIKSDASSNGTVWAAKFTGITHTWWLVNRYCDQQNGSHDNMVLSGVSRAGAQFFTAVQGASGGIYQKMTLS